MPQQDAGIMAELLVGADLRCVFSHGTKQIPGYIQKIQQGQVNPRPNIKVVTESPTALVLDGDGGLGYLPCYHGTQKAIAKAKKYGVAAITTRNHFHFGSAGNYTRMALDHDCIGIAISSHRFPLDPEALVSSAGAGPTSIAIPAGEQPPLVLDMGGVLPFTPEVFSQFPGAVFKSMGLAAVMRALGGVFAGIYRPEFQKPQSPWESNQGAFIAVFAVEHFMPPEELKREMDCYIGEARRMKPLPGLDRAELAGGLEWQWSKENRQAGIPVSSEHQESLEDIAAELGVEAPFIRYEHTRF